ncbi:MAG: galactose oxidase-like domain-containing protein [Acidimicrobiales bacterium]
MARPRRIALVAFALFVPLAAASGPARAAEPDLAQTGRFSAPFQQQGGTCVTDADGRLLCQPAGATVVNLATGRILYWDALEGTENVNLSIVAEFGQDSKNDRSRILDLSGSTPSFRTPSPEDAGANPNGTAPELLPLVPVSDPHYNDGDLFCSDQVQLADGSLLTVGGTDYYSEPYVASYNGRDYGVVELEGIKNSRIFDPYTETWYQAGSMTHGRWYPSLITLADGKVLTLSGVTKLLKPVYPDHPVDSGSNVKQLEVFDPATGQFSEPNPTANRSLPLYPRVHLLPDGHVYYDAAGQVFNPFGQSYDEAFWNIAASYDPAAERWTDLGVPGLGLGALPGLPDIPFTRNGDLAGLPLLDGLPLDGLPNAGGDLSTVPGFRGSAFSIGLPLVPDASGRYSSASYLSAGGVLGVSPGTYLGSASSQINTVTIDDGGNEALSTTRTGDLNQPRWYGTGVALPTGEVLAFSGANRDEVVLPGTGAPVTTPELFDPKTRTWRPLAAQSHARTYHNTAILLPDGRVLVGGHAPISTMYSFDVSLPGLSPNDGRDPSFEIYEPPYLFRGDRPSITTAPASIANGSSFAVTMASEAQAAAVQQGGDIVVVRNSALTHLVDADQRTVVLPVLGRDGATLTVGAPPDRNVAPAGPYMLFANTPASDGSGLVPSISKQVFVDAPVPAGLAMARPPADAASELSGPATTIGPLDVISRNLQRALVPTATAPAAASLDAVPASATRRDAPSGVVAFAGLLPFVLLLIIAAGVPGRRRPRRSG